jgi:hypothetical protein
MFPKQPCCLIFSPPIIIQKLALSARWLLSQSLQRNKLLLFFFVDNNLVASPITPHPSKTAKAEAELKRGKTMPKDWTIPKDAVSIVDVTVGDGVALRVDVDKGNSFVHMQKRPTI